MNIGIVTTWFPRGAAYVSKAYLETFAVKHNVFIYARGGERFGRGDPKWDRNYVTWGKRTPGKDGTYIDWEEFRGWVLENRIGLILFNEQNNWEIILKVAELPVLFGSYVDYYTAKTVPFFRMYDFLFCNTRRHYRVFQDHPQAFYVPWGTDTDLFQPRKNDFGRKEIVFFHSAGLNPYRKGTDLLVKSFQQLRGDAKLIIHAQTSKAFKKCPAIIRLAGKNPKIELIKKEIGPPGLYHLGDIYVYPTRLEGVGLTIPEALASGLPVITTDAEPMNEFITPDLNGKLVVLETTEERPEDYYWPRSICSADSLRKAMQFFVDNPQQIKEFQAAARTSAEKNFNWKKNSCGLPELVTKISRAGLRADPELINAVNRYEQSKYRNPAFLKKAEAALRRFRKKVRKT
jgi:1,2-diacylglycerol 3-alpha-glucosyltransferase